MKKYIRKQLAVITAFLLAAMFFLPYLPVREEETAAEEGALVEYQYLVPTNAMKSAVDVTDSGKLQLWSIEKSRTQVFIVAEAGDYYYFLESKSGKAIEVPDGIVANGRQLQLAEFDGSDKQLWELQVTHNGSYYIRSKLDRNYVIDNYGATSNNGARIAVNVLNYGDNQEFYFQKALEDGSIAGAFGYSEDEYYAIVPVHAGSSSLDQRVSDGNVLLYKTHRGKNQAWRLRPYRNYYYIENVYNGKVLEVQGDLKNGTNVRAANLTYKENQLWKIDPVGDGTYGILSKMNTSFGLDLAGRDASNDTNLQMWKYAYQANQRFRFVHEKTIEDMSDWGAPYSDCLGSDWDTWDGSWDNSWYYANTNARIYYIDTAAKLAGVAQLVRDNVTNFETRVIVLTKDINLAGIEWRRIGFSDRAFQGSFNGNGHVITGLAITTTDSQDGLFGEVDNGVITNLRVKGAVSGDWNTGGVVGNMIGGQLVNIYSEITIIRTLDDNAGGICGRLGTRAYVEHCTQNARVNSGDQDPDRAGIAGYATGVIRYCVNKGTIDCNWDYVGGISGNLVNGKIEYCANYGRICGGNDTQWAGGITGSVEGDGLVFGCYNEGRVISDDDDYIGGIVGERKSGDGRVYCCINAGEIDGDDKVGGIIGDGMCSYCFNAGMIDGDDRVGAVSGSAGRLEWCRSLSWTTRSLHGSGGDKGAEWISAESVISGELCYALNGGGNGVDLGGYGAIYDGRVFYQNLGGDVFPTFSGQAVYKSGNSYSNSEYEVRVSYLKDYGTVTGAGTYTSGKVTLSANPADGCLFDHFEVHELGVVSREMYSGTHDYPETKVTSYSEPTITLTNNIKGSYFVEAVFKVYDDTPENLRQKVKVELECVDDADGWNSSNVPLYLIDSAGERHLWEVQRSSIDGGGRKVSHTFDLGTASPVMLEIWPDFGGGLTFRALGLKARMWINNSGEAIESDKVTIRSWPFISSKFGGDYMHVSFSDVGNSTLYVTKEDGSKTVIGEYTSCSKALSEAKSRGKNAVIQMDSAWLTDSSLEISGAEFTLDLNGYPIIRSMKKTQKNGEVIKVDGNATLHIIDSMPNRKSCSAFYGGSIQGGRSTNGAGILHVRGTLTMEGGAVYNGGTTDVGGGIKVVGGNITLENTLISNCWSNKARFYDNNAGGIAIRDGGSATLKNCTICGCKANEKGGAVHMNSSNAKLTMENVQISGCSATDDDGGGIYQDGGEIVFKGGKVRSCQSRSDHGGGIYQNQGTLYCENVIFENNTADSCGGGLYIKTDDQTWLIGCEFHGNRAEDDGGAIYLDDNYLYLEDCTLTGNSCRDKGGAVFAEANSDTNISISSGLKVKFTGGVDVYGKIIIRDNNGSGSYDNLVMERQAYIYNQGLAEGSDIHVRSTETGDILLGCPEEAYKISQTQMQYFTADNGKIVLRETEEKATPLLASAFSEGRIVLYIGTAVLALFTIWVLVQTIRKKGERS